MTATIIPFPSERAELIREFGSIFPESTMDEREAFANVVAWGIDKHLIIEGRRFRQRLELQARPRPAKGEMVRRVLQRAQARRKAREAR